VKPAVTEHSEIAGRDLRAECAFTALIAVFGVVFLLATPPFQAPDEWRHVQRIFAINSGQFLATSHSAGFSGVFVPRSLLELEVGLDAGNVRHHPNWRQSPARLRAELTRPFNADDRVYVGMPSLYSPIAYLPSALVIGVARLLDLSAAVCVYAGRLGNVIAYAILVALALRWAPAHRYALGMLATTPMAVFEAASLGVDAVTNALALLFTTAVLRAAAASGPLRRTEVLELGVLAALVGLSKQAYAPLVLIVGLLPAARFSSTRARLGALFAVTAAGVVPTGLWFIALHQLELGPISPGSDPQEQVAFLLGHPLQGATVLLNTLVAHFGRYVKGFIGQLGSLDVALPTALYAIYPLVLLAVSALDGGRANPVRGKERGILLGVAVITWISVMLLAYIGWNVPWDSVVRHVQGRYFIPLAPLLACAVHLPWRAGLSRLPALLTIAAAAVVLIVASVCVVQRYWGA